MIKPDILLFFETQILWLHEDRKKGKLRMRFPDDELEFSIVYRTR
jgi:hypothetical protein